MLNRIITEINDCLDHEYLLAALTMALTLPDICGKAEYPTLKEPHRYVRWYDENIGCYEKPPRIDPCEVEMPYLSGEVVYNLRCMLLHQGTPNIERHKIHSKECRIDRFSLLFEKKKPIDIYADSAQVFLGGTSPIPAQNDVEFRSYEVNVRRLCFILTTCAEAYYKNNVEKFSFFQYNIVDVDERNRAHHLPIR